MAMLRPKYVVQAFKGARAVFVAGGRGAGVDPATSAGTASAPFDDSNGFVSDPIWSFSSSSSHGIPFAPEDSPYRTSSPVGRRANLLGPPGAGRVAVDMPPVCLPVAEQLFKQGTVLPIGRGATFLSNLERQMLPSSKAGFVTSAPKLESASLSKPSSVSEVVVRNSATLVTAKHPGNERNGLPVEGGKFHLPASPAGSAGQPPVVGSQTFFAEHTLKQGEKEEIRSSPSSERLGIQVDEKPASSAGARRLSAAATPFVAAPRGIDMPPGVAKEERTPRFFMPQPSIQSTLEGSLDIDSGRRGGPRQQLDQPTIRPGAAVPPQLGVGGLGMGGNGYVAAGGDGQNGRPRIGRGLGGAARGQGGGGRGAPRNHRGSGGGNEYRQPFHAVGDGKTGRYQAEVVKEVCQVLKTAGLHTRAPNGRGGADDAVLGVGGVLVDCKRHARGLSDALGVYKGTITPYHTCEILKYQNDASVAMAFFQWASEQKDYSPDVYVYTTLLGIMGRARDTEAVGQVFEGMRERGCVPTVVTYNRLLHAYARANMHQEAYEALGKMEEAGVAPDSVTYSTMVDLYSKAGMHHQAIAVYEEMRHRGLPPDTITLTMLITAYGRLDQWQKAYGVFQDMMTSGPPPNRITWNTMVDILGKAGRTEEAIVLYQDMKKTNLEADMHTFSTIISVCGRAGLYSMAEDFFTEMLEGGGGVPDAVTWNTLITMWGKAGQPKRAAMWFRKMLQAGCSPTVPAFNTLMYTFIRAELYPEAQLVFTSMTKRGYVPSLNTYTLLLSSCTACDSQATCNVLLDMMQASKHPAHAPLTALLEGVGEEEEEEEEGVKVGEGEKEEGRKGVEEKEEEVIMSTPRLAAIEAGSASEMYKGLVKGRVGGSGGGGAGGLGGKSVQALVDVITGEDAESKRAYSDALISFLHKAGLGAKAGAVWSVMRERRVWANALDGGKSVSFHTWHLNLHSMSNRTALVATQMELLGLRHLAMEESAGKFPRSLEIITGWGRRSRVMGSSTVKKRVEEVLERLGSPFYEDQLNVGRLAAQGEEARDWLLQDHVGWNLEMQDKRPK